MIKLRYMPARNNRTRPQFSQLSRKRRAGLTRSPYIKSSVITATVPTRTRWFMETSARIGPRLYMISVTGMMVRLKRLLLVKAG